MDAGVCCTVLNNARFWRAPETHFERPGFRQKLVQLLPPLLGRKWQQDIFLASKEPGQEPGSMDSGSLVAKHRMEVFSSSRTLIDPGSESVRQVKNSQRPGAMETVS